MNKIHNINEGYTLDFLIPAFFLFVIGGFAYMIHFSLVLLFVVIGIFLVVIKSSIEIDLKNCRARVVKKLFNIKMGKWVNLNSFDHVHLEYSTDSVSMLSYATETKVGTRTKTYDLIFKSEAGDSLNFHEFTDYNLASKVLEVLVTEFSYSSHDDFRSFEQRHYKEGKGGGSYFITKAPRCSVPNG